MKNTLIENTDIRVSRIAFGTASMHHLFRSVQRQQLLETAASAGITHFDTSPYYGYGLAETDLGRFLRSRRPSFTVTTKVGLYPWGHASTDVMTVWARKALGKIASRVSLPLVNWKVGRAKASLYESLRRLKTDYVDFVLLHEPDIQLIQAEEFMHWIETEHSKGTVRGWGLAGVANRVEPWLQTDHPLAKVIQTQDSLENQQADFMFNYGRNLQFTYGYLSSDMEAAKVGEPEAIMKNALQRNSEGAIIFSTRRAKRINQLVEAVS